MRVKDELKQQALFDATVKVVNEIGFASSSVAKIAKEANVSPATIYIYHKNKEDLLVSTYVDIKQNLSRAMLIDFDPGLPIRDILKKLWLNAFHYSKDNRGYMQFSEQFSHSPFATLADKNLVEKYFDPMIKVLQRGKEEKIIKDVSFEILSAFIFYPVLILSNPRLCEGFDMAEININSAYNLAWDAIKL